MIQENATETSKRTVAACGWRSRIQECLFSTVKTGAEGKCERERFPVGLWNKAGSGRRKSLCSYSLSSGRSV